MDTFTMNGVTVYVDSQGIRLKKGGEAFNFQPGEASHITSSLGLVARMGSLPSLPPKFERDNYTFFFQSDGTVSLFRTSEENGISFDIDNTDDMINVINAATNKHTDLIKLRGGPRKGVAAKVPDPIIEGREGEILMKVLVTGGCGLIGYHAAMYFHKQGHEVEVMDNLERSALLGHKVEDLRATFNKKLLEKEGIRVYLDDVSNSRNWDLHAGHDLILHYAGQCGVPTSIEKPRRDMEVNLIGTFNALEYARRHSATLCFASTNKVYPLHDCFVKKDNRWHFMKPEWDVKGFPVNTDLVGSRTPYGWSKYSADLLCQEYAHTYGVRTGVFRMSCIYGPNQFGFEEQGWATWFIIAALKNIPITIYGDGAQVRDMLYVEDCVKAYEAFYNSDMHHGVFNLGGGVGHTTTIWDHYKTIHAMADAKNPKVTFDTWRPLDQQCYVSDISPLHTTLGWQPTTSIQSGTDKTMEWVFDHLEVF